MRGSVFDLMTILVILVVFSVVGIFSVLIVQELKGGLVDTGLIDGTGGQILSDNETRMPTILDSAFLIIVVLGWIYLLVAGFLLNTNPAFLVIGVVFSLFILIFAAPIANVFLTISGMSTFSDAADLMPITTFVLSNALVFLIAMIITVLVSTYAGYRQGAGGVF
jgi:hypothetical protein